ncbi:hypothetical protein V8E55_010433 [Tylopilus felleus]
MTSLRALAPKSNASRKVTPRRRNSSTSSARERLNNAEEIIWDTGYDSRDLIFTSIIRIHPRPSPLQHQHHEERSQPRSLLSTRGRSPIRSGTVPAQLRRGGNSPLSRHPRRATVHIGSTFHPSRPDSESEQPSFIIYALAAAAEALSAPSQSFLSNPEGTAKHLRKFLYHRFRVQRAHPLAPPNAFKHSLLDGLLHPHPPPPTRVETRGTSLSQVEFGGHCAKGSASQQLGMTRAAYAMM